jgi:hypothetical protein
MLLEREIRFSAPLSGATWSALDTCSTSDVDTVQAGAPTAQDEPIGDSVVPTSPISSEDRLNFFLDAIQKKSTSTLLAAPTRPSVLPTPSAAPKRSSSRLANNKLAGFPIARRGEVLLMQCFDMTSSALNDAFSSGLSGGLADKVLDAFPSRKENASKAREEVLII